jgi:hypothetical protein
MRRPHSLDPAQDRQQVLEHPEHITMAVMVVVVILRLR